MHQSFRRGRLLNALAAGLTLAAVLVGVTSCSSQEHPQKQVVSWENARSYAGQQVIVEGPVVDTHFARTSKGQPTFLNLGRTYPDPERFSVIIWSESRARFPQPPEEAYRGKVVRVSGVVRLYEGRPEMMVDGPEDIEVVEQVSVE